MRFTVNPKWSDLPHVNALLNGIVRSDYIVTEYETTLSIKTVAAGEAWYLTPHGRYRVTPDVFLILNEGQRYSMEAGQGTETLCPFFAPGFASEALRAERAAEACLLEDVGQARPQADFVERLHPMSGAVGAIVRAMHAAVHSRRASQPLLQDQFFDLARSLVRLRDEDRRTAAAFPAARRTTREELYRRLHLARDFLFCSYAQPVSVSDAASVAMLSLFHFHRSFKAAFGVSPMQFLQARRLDVAGDLLRRGHRVTDVAGAVGFESHGSFSTLFRKRFGVAPRDLRKKQD
jgi:AraC-like DNA-binding protein